MYLDLGDGGQQTGVSIICRKRRIDAAVYSQLIWLFQDNPQLWQELIVKIYVTITAIACLILFIMPDHS